MQAKLIVGLGNPGGKYAKTRHNIGFIFTDILSEKLDAGFKLDKKTNAEIAEAGEFILAKPMTLMNNSGTAVSALLKYYKIKPENLLVIHDDIDILWKAFKISFGRSSAGHKGVESIIKALKTKNFWRLRVGIQPTVKKHTKADKVILKKFSPAEEKELQKTAKLALEKLQNVKQ